VHAPGASVIAATLAHRIALAPTGPGKTIRRPVPRRARATRGPAAARGLPAAQPGAEQRCRRSLATVGPHVLPA